MSIVIVAYEVGVDVLPFLTTLDHFSESCDEVFRQITPDHVELERAFVVAARSFGAPKVETA